MITFLPHTVDWYSAYLLADGNVFCYTRLEPVGVVGAIVPVSMVTVSTSICYIMQSYKCEVLCKYACTTVACRICGCLESYMYQ